MKAERLYYTDSWLHTFEAQVTGVEAIEGAYRVRLSQTAFYPTSGGQPFDKGTLGGARVLDIYEDDAGEVIHVLDAAPSGETVRGEIDAVRRFDHIQQHTGQHVLSAVFVELFGHRTVSFHLGEETCTIDLATPSLSEEQVKRAEARSNEVVFEDRPVRILFTTKEEAATLGLRKETQREGEIRIIEIDGLDRSACGGTHVNRTGQIGTILLRRIEKVKQGTRVEFVCGGRAVTQARSDFQALTAAAQILTARPHELPQLVTKKLEEAKASERECRKLQEALSGYEARELYAQATPDARGLRVVEKTFPNGDPAYVRFLAGQVAAQPAARAVFVLREPPTLVVAQSKGLPAEQGGADLGAIFKKLSAAGMRGGGSRDAAQAGAPDVATLDRALDLLRKELS